MIRTGIGFDAHRFAPGRKLILGGVQLDHEQGLLGHSDADVLAHALIDALLGALADGDIGSHFPDSDPRWKEADSLELLRRTARRIADAGWRIANTDATVIAQAPRLGPRVPEMRERLARAMNLEPGAVSVKATTTETMGAFGRGEGIAALAVATIAAQEP